MKNLNEKTNFCPLRHPSLNGRGNVCFYTSRFCEYSDKEKCEIYNQCGRIYARRVQEYQKTNQELIRKE